MPDLPAFAAIRTAVDEAEADVLAELAESRTALTEVQQSYLTLATQYADLISAHAALQAAYDELTNPVVNTVTVAAEPFKTNTTMIGWTSVQDQDHTSVTKAMLAECAHINNSHIIGFGANRPIQDREGGPYDFSYLDQMFGPNGYFPAGPQCVTLCGSPPYMRVPKPGAPPDAMGTRPLGLYDYVPVHRSHHHNFALLAAAIVLRYPHITALQWWNEGKGYYANNRWQIELMTECYNEMYTEVKAARPEVLMLGPYLVTRSYTADPVGDLANDAFPMELYGPWGYADKKILTAVMYFLANCHGVDVLCLDTKTSTNDQSVKPEYQWAGLQKILDWQAWLRKLATFDPAKYDRPEADCSTLHLWFAEAYTRLSGPLTLARHQEAAATDAWGIINYVLPSDTDCWMRWQPEGNSGSDSAAAHTIALWHDKGSTKALQPTKAYPVYKGLVEHFPPGVPLHKVTTPDPRLTGLATDKTLCLVSRASTPLEVVYNRQPLTLAPYEVRFMERA